MRRTELIARIASNNQNNVNDIEICNADVFLQPTPILSFSSCPVGFVRTSPDLLLPLCGLWALVVLFHGGRRHRLLLVENEVCVSLIRKGYKLRKRHSASPYNIRQT
jgi:hypothetical protein